MFESDIGVPMSEELTVTLSHTGGLRRTGIDGKATKGGDSAAKVARLLGSDRDLAEALLPLDFTRFEVGGDPSGSRAQLELMGASHVAMALPPIRSYVHLYPDQRDAMTRGLVRLRELLASV